MNRHNIFICPGASKAGTTTLYDVLKLHSGMTLTKTKETSFFVKRKLYSKGKDYYLEKYFDEKVGLIGEICPQYMSSNHVPERIFEMFGPEVKLIFMMRNPVERLMSHYYMKTRTFEDEALESIVDRLLFNIDDFTPLMRENIYRHLEYDCFDEINKTDKFQLDGYRYSRYIFPGFYADIIKEYLKYFNYENMKFVIFEEFILNIEREIGEILDFLKVESCIQFETEKKSNSKKVYKNKLSKTIRNSSFFIPMEFKTKVKSIIGNYNYEKVKGFIESPFVQKKSGQQKSILKLNVKEFYLPHVEQLESLINKDLSIWK